MARTADKVAVVTGGALGIGAATCAMLVREGAAVAITDVLEKEGQALAERIRADSAKAQFWALDVADEAAIERVFNKLRTRSVSLMSWSTTPASREQANPPMN